VTDEQHPVSERWSKWRQQIDLHEYHTRWSRREEQGAATHGEADLVERYRPASVLDAGCGMGRVAIELARRGFEVEGVDLDPDLLAFARADAPHLRWELGNLATVSMGRRYGLVAMPGNVMIFCRPTDRAPIVANMAAHLEPNGLLVAGFGLEPTAEAITLDEYDRACAAARLELVDRVATWEGEPYSGGDYAVSVHRLMA
jgi:2-polyprenyl-3-methyl-5-hydroxy-6-metoxy-1,4-benzoquinol methylase